MAHNNHNNGTSSARHKANNKTKESLKMTDQATWEERPKEVELIEETLSDDSKVYAVEVRQYEQTIKFDCIDKRNAEAFLVNLEGLLDRFTINDYKTL
jgi:FtsZ-interacting cell division protein YlmF